LQLKKYLIQLGLGVKMIKYLICILVTSSTVNATEISILDKISNILIDKNGNPTPIKEVMNKQNIKLFLEFEAKVKKAVGGN